MTATQQPAVPAMSDFKDHFSGHARHYAEARPTYPPALFEWLAGEAPGRTLAWDAGCGNGQASIALAPHFDRVLATDPSRPQIENAVQRAKVDYRVEPAERSSADDRSVDLISVAQAFHWLDHARFYDEVRRVAKAGALLAAYGYDLMRVSVEIDAVIDAFHDDVVGPYWPPERALIAAQYETIAFPFEPVDFPPFAMTHDWTMTQTLAYLETWSAVQRCRKATGEDPMPALRVALARAWGDAGEIRQVEWPMFGKVGRIA